MGLKKKHATQYRHLDAAQNIFFGSELRTIRSRTYDVKFPALKGKTLVPVDTDVDPSNDLIEYRQYTQVGFAKVISAYADDLPRADIAGQAFTAKAVPLGDSYGYNFFEIEKAQRVGIPLEQRKANAARRAMEEKEDEIIAIGDSLYGLFGLLNQPNASIYTIPDGAAVGTDPKWTAKTSLEILADMHGIAQSIVDSTLGSEQPDTLILPPTRYSLIATKYVDESNPGGQTVLQAFLATSPYIRRVEQWSKLETAGSGGTKRMVAYRLDPDALGHPVLKEFTQLPDEKRGLEVVVDCVAKVGGVIVYYPLSMAYGDNI